MIQACGATPGLLDHTAVPRGHAPPLDICFPEGTHGACQARCLILPAQRGNRWFHMKEFAGESDPFKH